MRTYQNTLPEVVCSHEELVQKSIDTIRHWEHLALKYDPGDGYWLAYSGGKDSDCLLELVKRAKVKYVAHYNCTTIDPPELCRHIRENHPEVIWEKPKVPFWKALETRALPTRLMRWCCGDYKEGGGGGKVKLFGVRAEESPRRKAGWQVVTKWKGKDWCVNPILFWSEENVWRFIKENNLPYCKLYDEGFKRLGCVGCPMSGTRRIEEFRRWPKFGYMWRRGAIRLWENKRHERKFLQRFKSGDELFDWWMNDNPAPHEDDCQMGLW